MKSLIRKSFWKIQKNKWFWYSWNNLWFERRQKREIIEDWIKNKRVEQERQSINKINSLNIKLKSRIILMQPTFFYKKMFLEDINIII